MASDGAGRVSRGDARSVGALSMELQLLLSDPSARVAHEIIAALLDVPRFWPSANGADAVDDVVCKAARVAAARLQAGAPFAYAVRRAAFRHLVLDVDERVLIPRPETEGLVEEVLRLSAGMTGCAIDVGTGSGAIALSLASEGTFEVVVGTDVSLDALAVARQNGARLAGALRSRLEFRHGSLLAPVHDLRACVIVSNPPYIAYHEAEQLPASVRDWEPALALFSGAEGTLTTTAIIRGAADLLETGGILALEVDARRASLAAESLAVDSRYREIAVRLDLAGRERFVIARRC
ncbi:MAG: peptide chain release factor N(5)-glutamine methyltransferase [Gemmatimonadota bacterium]|nr:peptide chain release factor N(5)-glutamine methyltransferase [Gemmatimonadota bacterium]